MVSISGPPVNRQLRNHRTQTHQESSIEEMPEEKTNVAKRKLSDTLEQEQQINRLQALDKSIKSVFGLRTASENKEANKPQRKKMKKSAVFLLTDEESMAQLEKKEKEQKEKEKAKKEKAKQAKQAKQEEIELKRKQKEALQEEAHKAKKLKLEKAEKIKN